MSEFEWPKDGGSYRRLPDGSLERIEPTTLPADVSQVEEVNVVAVDSSTSSQRPKRKKEE